MIYDPKREPSFLHRRFQYSGRKGNKYEGCATENWTTLQLPPFGYENRNCHKMTENKVVDNSSRKKMSPCPFHLEVWLARISVRIDLTWIPNSRDLEKIIPGIREWSFPGKSRDSGFGNSRDSGSSVTVKPIRQTNSQITTKSLQRMSSQLAN